MTTLTHCTSTIAWRITTCTEPARIVSQSLIITLTFMAQAESCTFHIHLHAIHVSGCFSLTRPSPLSTSSPSSCPSSFPSSSTSTTSCNQSSTRRTLKTCATPRRTRVRTLMTSSTPPHEEKLSFSSHAGRNASSFAQLVSPCASLRTMCITMWKCADSFASSFRLCAASHLFFSPRGLFRNSVNSKCVASHQLVPNLSPCGTPGRLR